MNEEQFTGTLSQRERDALRTLEADASIPLEHAPEPLKYLGFFGALDYLRFYHVPETGHFYAVYAEHANIFRRQMTHARSWDAIEKAELLLLADMLADRGTAAVIDTMWEDDSATWKPKRHGPSEAYGEPALPEIPDPPRTEEEAQLREAAALRAFHSIDWEQGGHKRPVPGAVYLWNQHYYVPATRRFYRVQQSGNYYHGYESDVSECGKDALLRSILYDLKAYKPYGTDIGKVLEQAVTQIAVYRLALRLPEGFGRSTTGSPRSA